MASARLRRPTPTVQMLQGGKADFLPFLLEASLARCCRVHQSQQRKLTSDVVGVQEPQEGKPASGFLNFLDALSQDTHQLLQRSRQQ